MSDLSKLWNKLMGKEPKPAAPAAPRHDKYKEAWPKLITLGGVQLEIDMTASEPVESLPAREAKKAAKNIVKMFDRPIAFKDGKPTHVEVYWIRVLPIKPVAGSDTVTPAA